MQGITLIKLGEKEYKASLNFGAIKMLQKRTGLTIDKVFDGVGEMNFDLISEILYCTIYSHNPKFAMKEIDALSYVDIVGAMSSLKELIENAMPKATEKK